MKLVRIAFLTLAGAAGATDEASAGAALERFALVVGANHGGTDRTDLRYAVADAERFARVLAELGGVRPESAILLKQPKVGELESALEELRVRMSEARSDAAPRPHRAARLLLRPRGREGAAARRGPLLVPQPARPARPAAGRRPHRRARRLRVRRHHAPQGRAAAASVHGRRVHGHARPRDPHVERGHRGGAGVRPHPGLLLHALPGLRPARRRRPLRRGQGHAQRGLPVRLRRDAGAHRRHQGRRAAPVLRHQPVGHGRRGHDGPAPDLGRAGARRERGRALLRAQRAPGAGGGALQAARAHRGAGRWRRGPTRCTWSARPARSSRSRSWPRAGAWCSTPRSSPPRRRK